MKTLEHIEKTLVFIGVFRIDWHPDENGSSSARFFFNSGIENGVIEAYDWVFKFCDLFLETIVVITTC